MPRSGTTPITVRQGSAAGSLGVGEPDAPADRVLPGPVLLGEAAVDQHHRQAARRVSLASKSRPCRTLAPKVSMNPEEIQAMCARGWSSSLG